MDAELIQALEQASLSLLDVAARVDDQDSIRLRACARIIDMALTSETGATNA